MDSHRYTPSFFLSYAHEDASLARELAWELERLGAQTWLDEAELQLGESLDQSIDAAIRQADIFLLLVTEAATRSEWVNRELQTALASEEGRGRTKVLPVRIDDAPMPVDLRGFVWLDARSRELHVAANELAAVGRQATRESETALVERVAAVLAEAGADVQHEPAIAGIRPDLIATLRDGTQVLIEVKGTPNPNLADVVRARTQVARLKETTGLAAFIVYADLSESLPEWGIVRPEDVAAVVSTLPLTAPRATPSRSVPVEEGEQERTVFAAMPFDAEYGDVYWVAMVQAANKLGAACIRVDQEEYNGEIPDRIRREIERAAAVIADLSEARANVLYETGFAHALRKETIHICSTPLSELPFDVRNWNTIKYSKGQTHQLTEKLVKRLEAVIGGL